MIFAKIKRKIARKYFNFISFCIFADAIKTMQSKLCDQNYVIKENNKFRCPLLGEL